MVAGAGHLGEPRFFGLYCGCVFDNRDPKGMGRIQPIVPAVNATVPLDWAFPFGTAGGGAAGHGIQAIPPIGAMVCVFFDAGDDRAPFYLGGWWTAPDGQSKALAPPATTVANSRTPIGDQEPGDPDNRIWETPKWRLWFRDKPGEQRIRIESKDEATQFIEIDGVTGDVTIGVKAGTKLLLGDTSAAQAAVLGDLFRTLFNAHTHGAGTLADPVPDPGHAITGVTGAPITPMTAAQLSTKVAVGT